LSGNIVAPSAPGEWESLPYGVKANLIDPSHPNSNYPDFRKAILRGVCAGVMMNYNTIARDLEGVSFSSIRQGVLSERDSYKILHAWFIDDHVAPVFNRWLRMALMSGELEGLTMRDYDRLCHAEFSGRTWDWVDPVKDIEAIEREIELGMNSLSAAAKAKGRDFNKIVAQKKEDIKTLEAAGLNTTIGKKETEMKKVEPVQGESTPPK
jgi:lambda family phage portal protein